MMKDEGGKMKNMGCKVLFSSLALLITVGCAQFSPPPTATPTATNTPKPTATATITLEPTITSTATPTRDPNFKEWPVSWFAENFAVAQKGDPNVSMTSAPCVYSDEMCVQTLDYCPEGTVCVGYLVVSPNVSFGHGSAPYSHSAGVVIGSKSETTLWIGFETFIPKDLFVTDKEIEIFMCVARTEENYVLESESLIPVNQAVMFALSDHGNAVFVVEVKYPRSLSGCSS